MFAEAMEREPPARVRRWVPRPGLLMLSVCLLFPAVPAEASEVVKLARLVITGNRLSSERMPPSNPRIEQLPPVLIEGQRSGDGLKLAVQLRGQLRPL